MESTALAEIDLSGIPDHVAKLAGDIAMTVADGKPLAHACRKHKVPLFTVMTWLRRYPQLEQLMAYAREAFTHMQAGELLALPDSGMNPQMASIHANNIKFLMARYNRKDYGDASEPQHQVQGALVDALKEAIGRIPRPMHDLARTIDAQPIEITGDNAPMPLDE